MNRLDGGSGDDEMTGMVVGLGRSIFNGGSGSDVLRVDGGQSNLLSGGGGLDRMFAGSGTDRLLGGGNADDFVFDVSKAQGADRILDFEGDLDRLCFIGLSDNGAQGLADDLDAITTVVDQGAGLDVVVTFDSGTVCDLRGLRPRRRLLDGRAAHRQPRRPRGECPDPTGGRAALTGTGGGGVHLSLHRRGSPLRTGVNQAYQDR